MLGPKEIKWVAPEFEYFEKSVSWYWLTIIAAILIIAFALWQKNLLFAIFIVLGEILLIYWGHRRPKNMQFKINQEGLEINDRKYYPYEVFSGFAIKGNELILKRKSRLESHLKFFVGAGKIAEIKTLINQRLPEIEYEESLADHLVKLLRF